MMDKKLYYKVVSVHNKHFYSFISGGKNLIEYKLGEWATPRAKALAVGYGCLVFETIEHVYDYFNFGRIDSKKMSRTKVFECEIGDIMHLPLMHDFAGSIDVVRELKQSISLFCNPYCWPNGTVMTNCVKLIREIKLDIWFPDGTCHGGQGEVDENGCSK